MLDTRRTPMVLTSSIRNKERDIPVDTSNVIIEFNTDLKKTIYDRFGNNIELATYFVLKDSDENIISSSVTYSLRKVNLHINQSLRLGEVYTIHINNRPPNIPGLTSVEGIEKLDAEKISFETTKTYLIKPPTDMAPVERSEMKRPFDLSWKNNGVATSYEVQIAKDETMSDVVYLEYDVATELTDGRTIYSIKTPIEPGQYYWRVASWINRGEVEEQRSVWSDIQTFYIKEDVKLGPVSPEDFPGWDEEEFIEDNILSYIEYVGSFPEDGATNVKTNLRVIYFKVVGEFNQEDVKFEMIGESVTGEEDDQSEVNYRMEVTEENGYKLVAFYFDELGAEPPPLPVQ